MAPGVPTDEECPVGSPEKGTPSELGSNTHPGSTASPASGASPGRSGILGSTCTALGRSYLCTAARREPQHTRRNLKERSVSSHQHSHSLGGGGGTPPWPGTDFPANSQLRVNSDVACYVQRE